MLTMHFAFSLTEGTCPAILLQLFAKTFKTTD